ncbi:DUF2878 family protein [Candidatus Woesearchaeota archaeon]|nr:DUF2878 family protein [Candidatus Woesearchaeota archaeon]
MKAKSKILQIFLNTIPIVVMIALIPAVKSDYMLAGAYACIIAAAFVVKREKKDWVFFLFGFFVMIVAECFFVSTGVETFERNSLFGVMPIWLPLLWAYVFVAMRRAVAVLDE